MKIYKILLDYFGPQQWWPADTEFEIIIGAILMPQTSWSNVEKAIKNLKQAGLMTPDAIAKTHIVKLKSLLKAAGLYQSKPRRLRKLCRYILEEYDGDVEKFLTRKPGALRKNCCL